MNLDAVLAKLRGVRRSASGWSACCPAHDDRHASFSIAVGGGKILLHCFAGCEFDAILEALCVSPADLSCETTAPALSREDRLRAARRLWERSRPVPGTIAERYLRMRGILIRIPKALRFIPLLMHREFGWPFPAMLAGVQAPGGAFTGVSATWLSADGSDKAPTEPPRKVFGPVAGGAVRLTPTGETLCIAEGIETALSVMQATGIPTWAALGTSNLVRVELPQVVREVIIAADADEPGMRAARAAAQRFVLEGRRVRIAKANGGKDFNDRLRA